MKMGAPPAAAAAVAADGFVAGAALGSARASGMVPSTSNLCVLASGKSVSSQCITASCTSRLCDWSLTEITELCTMSAQSYVNLIVKKKHADIFTTIAVKTKRNIEKILTAPG